MKMVGCRYLDHFGFVHAFYWNGNREPLKHDRAFGFCLCRLEPTASVYVVIEDPINCLACLARLQ